MRPRIRDVLQLLAEFQFPLLFDLGIGAEVSTLDSGDGEYGTAIVVPIN
jgi:hypothetical protein